MPRRMQNLLVKVYSVKIGVFVLSVLSSRCDSLILGRTSSHGLEGTLVSLQDDIVSGSNVKNMEIVVVGSRKNVAGLKHSQTFHFR